MMSRRKRKVEEMEQSPGDKGISRQQLEKGLRTHFDISTTSATASGRAADDTSVPASDEHDECCYSCGSGGELLCCDTCCAVFHLHCLWPKLVTIPKGTWSCPFCIVQGTAKGDVVAAELSIKKIHQLSRGAVTSTSGSADAVVSHLDDGTITVQKSAGRFIVRENDNNQATEVGRCYTLHEALEAAQTMSSGRKYHFSGVLSHEIVSTQVDTHNKQSLQNQTNPALRCSYCMDDPSVIMCAFCGCNACFGKRSVSSMLTCSDCGIVFHAGCSSNPPPELLGSGRKVVPTDIQWYCTDCAQGNSPRDALSSHREELSSSPRVTDVAQSAFLSETPASAAPTVFNSSRDSLKGKKKKLLTNSSAAELPALDDDEAALVDDNMDTVQIPSEAVADFCNQDENSIVENSLGGSVPAVLEAVISLSSIRNLLSTDSDLSKNELLMLDCFRKWAPLSDLTQILAVLKGRRAQLDNCEGDSVDSTAGQEMIISTEEISEGVSLNNLPVPTADVGYVAAGEADHDSAMDCEEAGVELILHDF